MKKFLVQIRCGDKALPIKIEDKGGRVFRKSIVDEGKSLCFKAILTEDMLNQLDVEVAVETKEDMESYTNRKLALVGKGNRYLN